MLERGLYDRVDFYTILPLALVDYLKAILCQCGMERSIELGQVSLIQRKFLFFDFHTFSKYTW